MNLVNNPRFEEPGAKWVYQELPPVILAGLGTGTLHSLWPLRMAPANCWGSKAAARLLASRSTPMHC
jgi:hypothetical protein